ncbi:N-6 DNA methylase [Flavobacterium psychrophilum]
MMQVQIKDKKIFAPLLDKWVDLNQEEKIKQEFIIRLINEYGYSIKQMKQDFQVKKGNIVDVAIWKYSNEFDKNLKPAIIITIDCKAEYISIKKEDIKDKYKLASLVDSDFFIAVNLKETKIFRIIKDDKIKEFENLKNLPRANQIINSDTIKKFIDETKTFSREDFTKLLNKCHNIIRNNDKLSPEAAFDEISKILFMKIMYERNPDKELIFTWDTFLLKERYYKEKIEPSLKQDNPNFNKDFIQFEFDDTKRKFKDHKLFEDNDIIKIKRNSFELIVRELEVYNLSSTSDDIKGIAFEEFLGRTFRGELGQFFTPRTVVDFMVKILDPMENETICDPCCGSGGFLIKSFEYVKEKIENNIIYNQKIIEENYSKKKSLKNKLVENLQRELEITNSKGRLYNLSYNCIYGTDANPRMARTAKMNMIMHGDGHGGVHHNDGLIDVNGIFENRFDVILTNPPFGARVDKNQLITETDLPNEENEKLYIEKYKKYDYNKNVIEKLKSLASKENVKLKRKGTPILDIFQTGKYSSLTEVLFIERSLNLLKPGGRMGIVLPEGVLNNTNLQKIRDYVEGVAKIILITSIPQDVFIASGATVKPSLLFFKKFTEMEIKEFKNAEKKATNEVEKEFKSKELEIKIEYTKLEVELLRNTEFLKTRKEVTAIKGLKVKTTPEVELAKKDEPILKQKLKEEKTKITKALKDLEAQKDNAIKTKIKEFFDYQIPIAEVEKAGISATGSVIDNELEPLEVEFRNYRKENRLWENVIEEVKYKIIDENIFRMELGKPQSFYGK